MSKPRERVTDLEDRVEELEATVKGLTEELVEKSERIRVLERQLEDIGPTRAEADGGETTDEETADDDPAEASKPPASEDANEEEAEAGGDDIIVA
jgi:predicted  nucleic acid-binding Zn-ribbon protein